MRAQRPSPWIAGGLCTTGALAMALVAWITGLPFVVPSLGGSLVLAAAAPGRPDATPTAMIVGHAIAIAAAVAALTLCGLVGAPSALLVGMTLPRVCAVGLALGLTMVAMLAAGTVHVPAGTTALLVALGVIRTGAETVILALAVLGIALVIAVFRTLTDRVTEALGGPTRRPAPRRRRTRQAT